MTTTAEANAGWTVQLAVHRAVRRDIARLSDALDGRATIPPPVLAYWAETARQLHHHHLLEDTVIYPLMSERLGHRLDSLLARNAREHLAMAAAMDELDAIAARPVADAAAARMSLARLAQAVETHLAHEERDVLPLIPDAFNPDDIAFFSAESGKTNPPDRFLPWVLDSAPQTDVEFFTATMPAPIRTKLESTWNPEWRSAVNDMTRTRSRS